MTATEQVILVDENDQAIGIAEKLAAHQQGLCHRAFSIFIFQEDKLLLQQRAAEKYHSPGLWTNTCCSHPRPGEDILSAAKRRLWEEMRISTDLEIVGRFHYIAHFSNGLIENEMDYVLVGKIENRVIEPNPMEVQDYRFITIAELREELNQCPSKFTPWLAQALGCIEKHMKF